MTLKIIKDSTPPWYSEGLRFKCTGCGQCCTGAPGYIWLNDEEVEEIAKHLNLSVSEFLKRYTRRVNGRISLVERSKTYDCIFLKDKKCQIYSVRPTQCRTFPWWPYHLKSAEHWEEAAASCEGIHHEEAPLIPFKTIQEQLAIQEEYTDNACKS